VSHASFDIEGLSHVLSKAAWRLNHTDINN
jgi:hypothetical protein